MKTDELYQMVLSKLGHIKDDEAKLSSVFILLEELEDGNQPSEFVNAEIEDGEEYKNLVMQIADALNDGFICFLNPDTLEIEQVDCKAWFHQVEIAEQNEDMLDEYELDYLKWDDYIRFDPFDREDLRIAMEDFAEEIDDPELSRKLTNKLEANAALKDMLKIIRHADKEEVWNVFKKQEIINYVKSELTITYGETKNEE